MKKRILFAMVLALALVLFAATALADCADGHKLVVAESAESTCEWPGFITRRCTVCGYSETEYLETLDHDYVKGYVSEATCEEDGLICWSCSICSSWYEETVPAKGHSYGKEEELQKPTCTINGLNRKTCGTCGHVEDVITENGPCNFVKATVSCAGYQSRGYDYEYCTGCLTERNKVAHSAVYKDYSPEPTCTAPGKYNLRCSVCNNNLSATKPEPAKGHKFGGWTEDTAPTCVKEGVEKHVCTECGASETRSIAATGKHVFSSWSTKTAATCTEKGTEVRTCTMCPEKQYRDVAPSHSEIAVSGQEATCVAPGTQAGVKCSACGKVLSGCEEIPATGKHKLEYTQVKKATCTEEGFEEKQCVTCDLTERLRIGKLEHSYKVIATTPTTCKEKGTVTEECTMCGLVRTHISCPPVEIFNLVSPEVPATCTQDGQTAGIICGYCGEVLSGCEVIPAKGHICIYESPLPNNCFEDVEGTAFCYVCEEEFTYISPALGKHPTLNVGLSSPATCTTPQWGVVSCDLCGYENRTYEPPLNHKDMETKVLKEATCTEEGTLLYYCVTMGERDGRNLCGYQYEEAIPMKDHAWGEWQDVGDGTQQRTCTVCGAVQQGQNGQPFCPGEHVEAAVEGVEPTCTQDGMTAGTKCSVCGKVLSGCEVVPAVGHITPIPSNLGNCFKDVEHTYRCGVCGETVTEVIKALGYHTMPIAGTSAPATCYYGRIENGGCEACGTAYRKYTPPYNHKDMASKVIKEATCEEDGSLLHYCVTKWSLGQCDYQYEEVIPATGHAWGEWQDGQNGEVIRTCETCSKEEVAEGHEANLPADDENHVYEIISPVEPTCEQPGSTWGEVCCICGFERNAVQVIPAKGHTESEIAGFSPTCEEDGLTACIVCSECGKVIKEAQAIAATGHATAVLPAEDATDTQLGKTEGEYCTKCGKVTKPQYGIDKDGNLYDENGNLIGKKDENGDIVDENGNKVHAPGTIVDDNNNEIGKVDDQGNLTDENGQPMGTIGPDGNVTDDNGNVIGKVDDNGVITDADGNKVGTIVGYDRLGNDGIPGQPNFNLDKYLDEYYTHVENGDQIRPTIDNAQCIIGNATTLPGTEILFVVQGAQDHAICPLDQYPMSQWVSLGDGNHQRICTCLGCDYNETSACYYFRLTVDGVDHAVCPLCGDFGEEELPVVAVKTDKAVKGLIARGMAAPFGEKGNVVQGLNEEPRNITYLFTAVTGKDGTLNGWEETVALHVPVEAAGDARLVRLDIHGDFSEVPYACQSGYVSFLADQAGLYLLITK